MQPHCSMEVLQSTRQKEVNEKDKNQLQEQLIYLGSGFIESYKCYTLSTSIREIHPVSHVSRGKATWLVQAGGTSQDNTKTNLVSLLCESPCKAHCVRS